MTCLQSGLSLLSTKPSLSEPTQIMLQIYWHLFHCYSHHHHHYHHLILAILVKWLLLTLLHDIFLIALWGRKGSYNYINLIDEKSEAQKSYLHRHVQLVSNEARTEIPVYLTFQSQTLFPTVVFHPRCLLWCTFLSPVFFYQNPQGGIP